MIKTLPFHCRGMSENPGWGTKIPQVLLHSQKKQHKKLLIYIAHHRLLPVLRLPKFLLHLKEEPHAGGGAGDGAHRVVHCSGLPAGGDNMPQGKTPLFHSLKVLDELVGGLEARRGL